MGLSGLAAADSKIGVVVLHGKWDSPGGHTLGFANRMEGAGFLVASPEMSWSGRRLYDVGLDGVVSEIDAAVNSLRAKGAAKVCLAGHSMGAAGAILYAGRMHADCLIALAPGHNPEGRVARGWTEKDLAKAKEMSAKGEGDEKAWFEDFNTGNRFKKIRTTAKVYVEFFDGDGPMNMANNASRILPGTPVLWVVGSSESEGLKNLGGLAYKAIPDGVPKQFSEVPGEHLSTPEKAVDVALDWIRANVK
jgi:dienelactone hydrolase